MSLKLSMINLTESVKFSWLVSSGQAMYEQNCKKFNRLRYKQHSTIAMLLTSWSFFLRAKPSGKKHMLLRSGWPAAAPSSRPSESKGRNDNLGET